MANKQTMIFNKKQLQEFLMKLDIEVTGPSTVFIIGGAAATLMYDSKSGTVDIDTWGITSDLTAAYNLVIKKYPNFKLPFGPVTVHIQSPTMLSRFVSLEKFELKNLTIKVPLPEDLFLLKAQRADEKDIGDLIELNKKTKLDSKKILHWFRNDLLPINPGSDDTLISNYLFCIDQVFGSKEAKVHPVALTMAAVAVDMALAIIRRSIAGSLAGTATVLSVVFFALVRPAASVGTGPELQSLRRVANLIYETSCLTRARGKSLPLDCRRRWSQTSALRIPISLKKSQIGFTKSVFATRSMTAPPQRGRSHG